MDEFLWREDEPMYTTESDQWKVLEPEFALFIASKSFTVGGDTIPCPYAHMSDGYLDGMVFFFLEFSEVPIKKSEIFCLFD